MAVAETVKGPVTVTVAPAVKLAPAIVKLCAVEGVLSAWVVPKSKDGTEGAIKVGVAELCGVIVDCRIKSVEFTLVS